MSLLYLIPTDPEPNNTDHLQTQAQQYPITQEEERHPTHPKPTNVAVEECHQLTEGVELGPPSPLFPTANYPPQGPTSAPQRTRRGSPFNLKDVCAEQHGIQSLAAYPNIFDLLNTNTTPKAKDCLETLVPLSLEELPYLVVVVAGPPRHARVLWGIERLPVPFTNS